MKKLTLALLTVLCLMLAVCAMAEVETPEPIAIDTAVSITDYGVCSFDSQNNATMYGYILDSDELKEADLGTPCFYVGFTNTSDVAVELKLYIRGGKKYDCYWSKTVAVNANDTYYFVGQGYKTASKYAGAWSVEVRNKKTAKFSIYAN